MTPCVACEESRDVLIELIFRDRESGEPERSSESEDSLVDQDFGDSQRSGCFEVFVSLLVELFEDQSEDIVGEGQERGRWMRGDSVCEEGELENLSTHEGLGKNQAPDLTLYCH